MVVSRPSVRGPDGILSDSDCQASNCWLKRRDGRYRNRPLVARRSSQYLCAISVAIVLKREKSCLLVMAAAVAENQGGRKMGQRLKIQRACARPHGGNKVCLCIRARGRDAGAWAFGFKKKTKMRRSAFRGNEEGKGRIVRLQIRLRARE